MSAIPADFASTPQRRPRRGQSTTPTGAERPKPTLRIEEVEEEWLRAWADAGIISHAQYVEEMRRREKEAEREAVGRFRRARVKPAA